MGTGPTNAAPEVPPHETGEIDCEDFLEFVYGERSAWIDLPAKVGKYWVPFYMEWPNEVAMTRRIDSSLRDREDLYYSVCQFSRRGRRIEDVLPSSWLWADLDEVKPSVGASIGFLPTVAVESSPGRYQALWRLTREIAPKSLEKLNRGLSYALDADRGGWDLTQVLRIPGTRNFKYKDAPMVRILWINEEAYDPKEIWSTVRSLVPDSELRGAVSSTLPRRPIPARAKALLRTPVDQVVEGERSSRLWELECLLAEAGLGSEEIYGLVERSAWNKWRGVASGRERLKRDVQKAIRHVAQRVGKPTKDDRRAVDRGRSDKQDPPADSTDEPRADSPDETAGPERLPFVSNGSFMAMSMEQPRWLIEDIWTAGSHGLIAGEPKTNKTTLALALSLSVASGAPFLGRHPVGVQGPVLFVQEENAPWMMQDRLRKLAWYYGLLGRVREVKNSGRVRGALGDRTLQIEFPRSDADDLPIRYLNNFGFNLALEDHRDMLEAEVEAFRPVLVVLDPLYLVFGAGDENSSASMRPFLAWTLQLRYRYNCAVIVVHHFRKQTFTSKGKVSVRPGQRIMGSGTLHGWVDSALYLEHVDEPRSGWVKTRIEREFRAVEPQKPMELSMHLGKPGDRDVQIEFDTKTMEQDIAEIALQEPGIAISRLADVMGIDRRTVLSRCRGSNLIFVKRGGKGRGQITKVFHHTAAEAMNGA